MGRHEKRTLELSHAEVALIEQALTNAYFDKLTTARDLRKQLEHDAAEILIEKANRYGDLQAQIDNGDKDV